MYGKAPGLKGATLIASYKQLAEEFKASPPREGLPSRAGFLEGLEAEIRAFERLAELHQEKRQAVSGSMKDAHMLPSREEVEKVVRYETLLENQFERRLKQFVGWRRRGADGGAPLLPRRGPGRPAGRSPGGLGIH